MISEICKLHSRLANDKKIVLKMIRYDYETAINKDDDLKIIGSRTLKITRPSKAVILVNVNYIMNVYTTDKEAW